jgi:fluoroquinolone transport system permease protein
MTQLAALIQKDARVVYRDSFLILLSIYSLGLALVMRLLVRWIPVENLRLYLAPAVILFGPVLLGTVLGFALIEEREQGTWFLLRVLPLRPLGLFTYLSVTAGLVSGIVGLAAAYLYGYSVADEMLFGLMILASSATAPLVMLVLGTLCSNKIEGMAASKLISFIGFAPAVVFVLPMPWQLVVAWCPWYWVYLGLLRAYAGDPAALSAVHQPGYPEWLLVLAPISLCLIAIFPLARRYMRQV